ncbi:rhombosortase [Pseudoalteromonas mariniglutinosa]|uniref:rhombosortase n=1 Tax=Pseudoalteromonas mariniglutinosa TaxID=206042 RepID=UPI00384DE65B
MLNLPLNAKYLLPPICLILLSTLLAVFNLNSYLEFNRELVTEGQLWRIFTSQFVHTNWAHLALNCAGIMLIWALHAEYTLALRYAVNTCFLAIWCGVGIWLFCPEIKIYTGLSGVLHGSIVWGAIKDIRIGMLSGIVLFIGIGMKIIWEQFMGTSATVSELIASQVAVDAHLIGAVGGVLLAIPLLIERLQKRQP